MRYPHPDRTAVRQELVRTALRETTDPAASQIFPEPRDRWAEAYAHRRWELLLDEDSPRALAFQKWAMEDAMQNEDLPPGVGR